MRRAFDALAILVDIKILSFDFVKGGLSAEANRRGVNQIGVQQFLEFELRNGLARLLHLIFEKEHHDHTAN